MSVRMVGGRAVGIVERFRAERGIDLRRVERSDFRVLCGSLRPVKWLVDFENGC